MLSTVAKDSFTNRFVHKLFIPAIKHKDLSHELKCPIISLLTHICKNNCVESGCRNNSSRKPINMMAEHKPANNDKNIVEQDVDDNIKNIISCINYSLMPGC